MNMYSLSILKASTSFIVVICLTGCGDSEADLDEAYWEGYDDGQYAVCRQIDSIAPAIESGLSNCRGF